MAAAKMTARQLRQANNDARAALLATAPRMRKNLGVFTGTAVGQSTRIKLLNVGILTMLSLLITAPVVIGTAVATASAKAPYNVIGRLKLTDYDGTDRVNLSGFQLFILNCVRNKWPVGYNNVGPIINAGGSTVQSGIIAATGGSATGFPNVPLNVGSFNIQYIIDVPVAYDPENDLRGAIMAQTNVGEMYLTIDWAASLYTNGDLESVYRGGATTTVALGAAGFQATVFQHYLLPQQIPGWPNNGGIPLPTLDLMTVYELNGNIRTSDNLAVNTEKLIAYPNFRTVMGAYFNYAQGAALNANDLSTLRLIANGNNVLWDYTLLTKQIEQRNYVCGDLAAGVYWFMHRTKPIETALLGNVQAGITPITVGATPYIEYAYESFYTKGAALPGMQQAS